jgi:mannose-6-phosphate isomerase-like protein (cupin superfamily)
MKVNRDETAPFTTADGSTIREFLNPRNSPLRNQSLAEATLLSGQSTAPHYHPIAEEIYFIVEGEGLMKLESETFRVQVGDAVAIPNGVVHQIMNDSELKLVFLCQCSPAYTHEDTILVNL